MNMVYKYLVKSLLLLLLGIYLEVELLDHMVILFNFSRNLVMHVFNFIRYVL